MCSIHIPPYRNREPSPMSWSYLRTKGIPHVPPVVLSSKAGNKFLRLSRLSELNFYNSRGTAKLLVSNDLMFPHYSHITKKIFYKSSFEPKLRTTAGEQALKCSTPTPLRSTPEFCWIRQGCPTITWGLHMD